MPKRKRAAAPEESVLSEEFGSLVTGFRLTAEEGRARRALKKRVAGVVTSYWPLARVTSFGSQGTRVEWFESDVDLRVVGVPSSPARACLELGRVLRTIDWASGVECRPKARVPVVVFEDRRTGVEVDVSFGPAVGNAFATEGTDFFDLVLLLKIFLKAKRLDKPFDGGLGSFRLAVLVRQFRREEDKKKHSSLKDALRGFFAYCHRFDFYRRTLTTASQRRDSSSGSVLRVAYSNVDVPLLKGACRAALTALDKDTNNCLVDLFSRPVWNRLQRARLAKLQRAKDFASIYLDSGIEANDDDAPNVIGNNVVTPPSKKKKKSHRKKQKSTRGDEDDNN